MSEKKKILIIEDNKDLVLLLSKALRSEGFLVASARDGIKGFKLAEEEHHDLIILDLDIPGIKGLAVLKKLRNDKRNKKTPVIIFSNYTEAENLSEALEQGVLDYLPKSDWELNEVVEKVKKALGVS